MDKLIDAIQRKRETLLSVFKLTLAAVAAFGAGYLLRCVVELAKSAPVEPTAQAVPRRITTAESLWTCPVHPDCPLSKLNSCTRCRAGWSPLYCCPDAVAPERVLATDTKTAPAETTPVCKSASVCCRQPEPNTPRNEQNLWTQHHQ